MTFAIEPHQNIYIAESNIPGAGRGVFAKNRLAEGTHIERCPVILLTKPEARSRLRKTELVNYYFLWNDAPPRVAICLGWGSIYNHSFSPNAKFENNIAGRFMDFYTMRDIEAGEEIFVNYNGDPTNTTPLAIPGIPESAGGARVRRGIVRIVYGLTRRTHILARKLTKILSL